MSTAFYRPVPGHPSKHGANIGTYRSRPMFRTMPVKVQLPVTWYMIAAPGVR